MAKIQMTTPNGMDVHHSESADFLCSSLDSFWSLCTDPLKRIVEWIYFFEKRELLLFMDGKKEMKSLTTPNLCNIYYLIII